MAIRIVADLSLCEGWAQCVSVADEYFDLDDNQVKVLTAWVDNGDLDVVENAVLSCPVNALSLEADNDIE